MKPDGLDPADDEFYNMEWMPYAGVYVGFLSVFHTTADRLDVRLVFSRDNRNWCGRASAVYSFPTAARQVITITA